MGAGISGAMARKHKAECCEKYKKKGKACKDCPVVAKLSKKERKKLLAKYR